MGEFFDKRADLYDAHQKECIANFEELYKTLYGCLPKTREKIRVLDIGCGTGLELEGFFERAPNSAVTAIDVSANMLERLTERFQPYSPQITTIQDSYLNCPFERNHFDFIVAAMTLHHLLPEDKKKVYAKILGALKVRGVFVELDYIVSEKEERDCLKQYTEIRRSNDTISNGSHHIDIPLSLATETRLLKEAGFSITEIILEKPRAAVIKARR